MRWTDYATFFVSIIVVAVTSLLMTAIFGGEPISFTHILVVASLFTIINAVRDGQVK